jgi:hypothetical protein
MAGFDNNQLEESDDEATGSRKAKIGRLAKRLNSEGGRGSLGS